MKCTKELIRIRNVPFNEFPHAQKFANFLFPLLDIKDAHVAFGFAQ